MSVTIQVISPWGVSYAGSPEHPLPYAFREDQPPVPVTITHAYRLKSDPDHIRLMPAQPNVQPGQVPAPHVLGYRPVVIHRAPFTDHTGAQYNAQIVKQPAHTVMQRIAALTPGQTATAGSPRPYRLTDAELQTFNGLTVRPDTFDLDGQW